MLTGLVRRLVAARRRRARRERLRATAWRLAQDPAYLAEVAAVQAEMRDLFGL